MIQILALCFVIGVCEAAHRPPRNRFNMAPKTNNKSIGAEEGYATCRTHQSDKNKAGARRDVEGARARRRGLRAGLRGERRQGGGGIKNGGVAKKNEDVRAAAARRGLQGTPEVTLVVGSDESRRGSGACSERTGGDTLKIEAFVDLQRERNGEITIAGEA